MHFLLTHWFTGNRLLAIIKKMDEESRFDELSTEEIQQIMDNAVLVTIKNAQSSR